MKYAKPWLPIEDQVAKLRDRGCQIDHPSAAAAILAEIGYYRLTGYLYPFRESRIIVVDSGRRTDVLDRYRVGTDIRDAEALIAFDRLLRLLVIEAVERLEVAMRTQLGHVLGARCPFAHEEAMYFTTAFTASGAVDGRRSAHETWLERVGNHQNRSDEAFVAHFRDKYDDRMPIWALTEILELGHLTRLYGGLRNDIATEIANAFGVPTKRMMTSWLVSVNYVRNVAAHHARLFNRKLVITPKRPRAAELPVLAHLSDGTAPKEFGVYGTLAVMAYLLRSIPSDVDWAPRTARHLRSFPAAGAVTVGAMGVAPGWLDEALWKDD
jgi:abortive infection bacteriophage resistance protein